MFLYLSLSYTLKFGLSVSLGRDPEILESVQSSRHIPLIPNLPVTPNTITTCLHFGVITRTIDLQGVSVHDKDDDDYNSMVESVIGSYLRYCEVRIVLY